MPTPSDILGPMPDETIISRKLLICISDDRSLLHGVRFVAGFFQPAPDLHIDLAFLPRRNQHCDQVGDILPARALQEAREILAGKGLVVSNASQTTPQASLDEASSTDQDAPSGPSSIPGEPCVHLRDMTDIAEHRRYDAVILGQRGARGLVSYLDTTFRESRFDRFLDFPFWICREPELDRAHVLLCVDGSKPSLCAADHVGQMCATENRHNVCVVYLADPGKRDQRDERLLFENAVKMLQVNGIADTRITTKVLATTDHFQSIEQEVRQGGYAVVAVGRAGTGRGMMAEQQFGSVTLHLARNLTGASLWIGGYPCKL